VTRFIIRRLLLALVTLAILLIIVTLIPNIAPGDPARKIAGGTASPERLIAGHRIARAPRFCRNAAEEPVGLCSSHLTSENRFLWQQGEPVMSLVWKAVANSAKLVILSLLVIVPVSILGGLVAAYKKDSWIDRLIVNTGLAFSAIPDFVAGVFLLAF